MVTNGNRVGAGSAGKSDGNGKKKHKKKGPVLQEEVSPNLIPMVDIMFLLLLFLMLGSDMGQREFEDVILPIASAVQEDKDTHKEGVTTVNVYHKFNGVCENYKSGGICSERAHWSIGIRGQDYTPSSIATQIKAEADMNRDKGNPTLSDRKVQIRADQSALYEYVQKVIEACALAGLYKIEIGAAQKNV
jgi:biopolymer transport protein ExbD